MARDFIVTTERQCHSNFDLTGAAQHYARRRIELAALNIAAWVTVVAGTVASVFNILVEPNIPSVITIVIVWFSYIYVRMVAIERRRIEDGHLRSMEDGLFTTTETSQHCSSRWEERVF